jgi:hypothetical protein
MKYSLSALFVLLLFATACKKDSTPTPPAVVTYQPVKAGSTWNYNVQDTVNAANSYSYTLRATGTDTTAAGKTYSVFTNTASGSEYYLQNGENYYQFGAFQGLTNAIELNYLRTNATVGSNWQDIKPVTISGFPVNVTFKYTLVEKLPTYVVNTVTFNDVLHVKVELTVPGLTIAAQDVNFYYAKGIGRVRSNILLKIPFVSINTGTIATLTSYTIAP